MRYIDADKLVEMYERSAEDDWNKKTAPSSWAEAFECAIADIDDQPTANVVPKSEVLELENKLRPLEDKLRQYEQICGNIVVKDGAAVGLLNGKETVYVSKNIAKVTKELAIRRTRQEVAREIFEEIEKVTFSFGYGVRSDHTVAHTRSIDDDLLAELKKKYTEDQSDG